MGQCPIPRESLANDGLHRCIACGKALRVARDGHFTRQRVGPVGVVNRKRLACVCPWRVALVLVAFFAGFPVNEKAMVNDGHASIL